MEQTLDLKKEYADKLKRFKVYRKFVKYTDQCLGNINLEKYDQLAYINRAPNFYQFVERASLRDTTPEGHAFWKTIAAK